MPALPTSLLRKADLQSLLSQMAEHSSAKALASSTVSRAAKQWASYANLTNGQELTAEGRLVVTKDPYLEATVTDWLIHFHLSLSNHSLWNYFVYEFLPKHSSFTQDELFTCCLEVFKTEPQDKLKKNIKLILRTYTEQQAISKNKFLTQQKKSYLVGNPDLSNPYTTGYFLAKIWEREFKTRASVLVNEIIDAEMGLSTILGISKESLLQQLDVLAEHKVIEQRSAKPHLAGTKPQTKDDNEFPYQVHRCWDTTIELLEKAYESDIATPNRPLIQSLGAILDDDDDVPDFSQFLEWASRLTALDGGSNTIVKLVS